MNPADMIIQDALAACLERYGFQLLSESLAALDGLSPEDRSKLAGYAEQVTAHLARDKGLTLDIDVLALACLLHLRFDVLRAPLPPDAVEAFARYSQATAEWESRTHQVLMAWSLLSRMTKFVAYPDPVRGAFERLASHYALAIPPAGAPHLDVLRFFGALRPQMKTLSGKEFEDAWQALSPDDVAVLVNFAIAVHEGDVFPGRYVANTMLARLACLVPGALEPYHARIADAGICYPGVIFHGAGAAARDRLIERLRKRRGNAAHVEIALAFIGDEETLKVVTPEMAIEAGWEKTRSGERRLLYYPDCFQLVPPLSDQQADDAGPITVIASHDNGVACPCCRQPLMLLFDLDLRDPRLGFLRLSPRRTLLGRRSPGPDRLPMTMCPRCVHQGGVFYAQVDAHGRSIPIEAEGAFPPTREEQPTVLPERKLVLGGRRITPVQAASMAEAGTPSQIGGFPCWEQYPVFPMCCRCEQLMTFVGQVGGMDIGFGGALYYGFLCPTCWTTATSSQQS